MVNFQPAYMATSETSQLLPRKSKLKRHRNSDSSKTPPVDKDSDERPAKRQRLLIVANRLPLSAERNGQDPWSLKATVGGLANALFGEFSSSACACSLSC